MNRRSFIRNTGLVGAGIAGLGLSGCGSFIGSDVRKITILHTNDLHSRIDPFPTTDGRYPSLGGLSRIATMVKQIRQEEKNLLLFDSGDIFQGTPYFNYYGGELEFKLMSQIGYDAATLGNHDFDNGIDGLIKQMPHANFPFLNSNYDVSDTALEGELLPFKVFEMDEIRVGVFGLGIELQGLVNPNLYGKVRYKNPVSEANSVSFHLRHDLKCNLVVCLSHLGLKYGRPKVSDLILAQQTDNIDVILGGHTHSFLDQPEVIANIRQNKVLVCQVGWAGIKLGKLSVYLDADGSVLRTSYFA